MVALTRELLLLRQQYIVPLLAHATGHNGTVVDTAPGYLAVRWTFPGGTLSMALNLGEQARP
jgi:hypothetical protein